MGFFENFPFTNFHELNLDWVIRTIKSLVGRVDDIEKNTETYVQEKISEYVGSQEFANVVKQYVESAKFNLVSMAVIGDSNAEGYGWWQAQGVAKTVKNDGYCAVLRELYPDATIDNYAVGGATLNRDYENNLSTQLTALLASQKQYQYILVQAGFNDVVTFFSSTSNWQGFSPKDQSGYVDNNTSVGSLCYILQQLKSQLPQAKIFFVARENNYTDLQYSIIYNSLFRELFTACNVFGVPVLNLNMDCINSFVTTQRALFYVDDVHWSEYAFRNVVAPLILLGITGFPLSANVPQKALNIPSITIGDITAGTTTISDGVKDFINAIPEGYYYAGDIRLQSNNYISGTVLRKGTYRKLTFERITGWYEYIFTFDGSAYVKYNLINSQATSINNEYQRQNLQPAEGQYYSYDKNSFGEANCSLQTTSGSFIKTFENLANQKVKVLYNDAGQVSTLRMCGGMLTSGNLNNPQLGSGIYYIPSSAVASMDNYPPTTQGGILMVAKNYLGDLGFLLFANGDGAFVATAAAVWTKLT